MVPAPFLKWAGGKRQLLAHIEALLPERIDTYFEPFLGGAAVFFRLAAGRRFRRAVLADANPELVNCYQAIRDDVDGCDRRASRTSEQSRALLPGAAPRSREAVAGRARRAPHLPESLRLQRPLSRQQQRPVQRPVRRYRRPVICDEDRLRTASAALREVEIRCDDFANTLKNVGRATSSTSIRRTSRCRRRRLSPPTPSAISAATDQERLADVLRALGTRKVPALLSNSDCPTTRDLYR